MRETKNVQKNNIDIEATALEVFNLMKEGKMELCWERKQKLFEACWKQRNMPGCSISNGANTRADEADKYLEQHLDAFLEAWEIAWERFTGTGSFMALLRSCYSKKKRGCKATYYLETEGELDQKLRQKRVKTYLKKLAKAKGLKLELSKTNINVLNMDSLEAFVKEKGLVDMSDEATTARELEKLYAYVYNGCVIRDEVAGEGDEGESFHLSDAVSVDSFHGQASYQDDYSLGGEFEQEEHSRVEKALRKFGETKKGDVLKMLLTYGVFCRQGDTELLAFKLEEGFYAFLCANPVFDNPTEAITAYTGKERETVRKDVSKILRALNTCAPAA